MGVVDQTAELEIDWPVPLFYRQGGPKRLNGIDLFYDFPWLEQFKDWRAQFKNGLCLATLAEKDCPVGKIPALLLTRRDEIAERLIETPDYFIVVVNLPRYLREASNNAAASYYASRLSLGITSLSLVSEIRQDPEVVAEVIRTSLDIEGISAWLRHDPDRLDQLRTLTGNDPPLRSADAASIAAAIDSIGQLDADQLAALEGLLRGKDRDARLAFLRALTSDEDGRYVTSLALGERLNDRLKDVSGAAAAFSILLEEPSTKETDLQSFIEEHPWLLGLEYVSVLSRRLVPRGSIDFLLRRFDGYYDLLELKGSNDGIIEAPQSSGGLPPRASSYSLSRPLAQAMAQVHVYQDTLTAHHETVSQLYGLEGTRSPRLIIVIGRAKSLPDHVATVLRNINLSLHRVEIVPFDVMADRALTTIRNIESLLLTDGAR